MLGWSRFPFTSCPSLTLSVLFAVPGFGAVKVSIVVVVGGCSLDFMTVCLMTLQRLLFTILSAHVRAHIRRFLIPFLYVGLSFHSAVRYNMAFAMASTGHANRSLPDSTFILGGRTFHRIGSLSPNDGAAAAFAQIYLLDPDDAAARRSDVVGNFAGVLRQPVFHMLHELLLRYNPWVQQLVASASDDTPNVVWQSDIDVSGMVIGAVVAEPGSRSIVIQKRSAARPEFISDRWPCALSHACLPITFPHRTSWVA
jgi:hypothetical protein